MILENDFRVAIPPHRLWPLLADLEQIAPCLPGGTVTERVDTNTYRGAITIRVGPVTVSYQGVAKVTEMLPESGRMVMRCEGRETRGPGSAGADITIEISGDQDGSAGHIRSDVTVTGRVAQFGRGMMAEVGDRILTGFANCLEETVTATASSAEGAAERPSRPAQPQVNVLRLLLSVVWVRLRFWRRR